MKAQHTLADRLRARAHQLGLSPAHVAEMAGVKRSFVNDILRGRSMRPGIDKLAEVAAVLKVDRDWLIHGMGDVEGTPPFVENPDAAFVSIAQAGPRPPPEGDSADPAARAFHFRRAWIRHGLKASPSQLRIMRIEGDSMAPSLLDGDTVLVDLTRCSPSPPGIFVLNDGLALVARRLEHVPGSSPPALRITSDNRLYGAYERAAEAIDVVGRIRWFGREV